MESLFINMVMIIVRKNAIKSETIFSGSVTSYLYQELFGHEDAVMKITTQFCHITNDVICIFVTHTLINKANL